MACGGRPSLRFDFGDAFYPDESRERTKKWATEKLVAIMYCSDNHSNLADKVLFWKLAFTQFRLLQQPQYMRTENVDLS